MLIRWSGDQAGFLLLQTPWRCFLRQNHRGFKVQCSVINVERSNNFIWFMAMVLSKGAGAGQTSNNAKPGQIP